MAAHEDEAVEVVEGAKADGAAVAGQIVAWIDRRSALRRHSASMCLATIRFPIAMSFAVDC